VIKECQCNPQIFVEHHGKGKFRLERQGKEIVLFARVSCLSYCVVVYALLPMQFLRDKIMVRVGGGWDTLDHFLLKHDPCRVKG